ncbi:mitochondrial fission ELM1 family protein [Thermomonas alba]|uniref:mitochondrial fission ELM1 family protein n=1 Tax=Thermomonas alba TaxID=2888525 RepID=UPI001F04E945|nr:mitochondrial fission ELM1 family protein [Thermomonas alba]
MKQSTPAAASAICLAVHDGRAGNARQALALARALQPQAEALILQPRAPWRWWAPRRLPGAAFGLGAPLRTALMQPPGLAVGCGRQAALATRLLRRAGARVVQILDPRLPPRHWDALVVPEHDRLRGDHVITLLGSLHPVDDAWLSQGRAAFSFLAALPAPHTVLLVGGPSRHAALDDAAFQALLRQLAAHARAEGGSFSAIASRRTPPAWRAALGAVDAGVPGLRWRDTGDGANPYAGLLAHADRLVCTPDSVNMLSEAAATHAPLFVWQPERVHGRVRRFIAALLERGRARALDATPAAFAVEPLRETARVAAQLRQRLGLA